MLGSMPRALKPKTTVSISIRFPTEMADRLAKMAADHFRPINGEVLRVVEQALKEWEAEQDTR